MLIHRIATAFIWVLFSLAVLLSPQAHAQEEAAPAILHLLDYVGVDYPGTVKNGVITNPSEYAEQKEFARRLIPLINKLPAHPDNADLQKMAQQLIAAIDQRQDGEKVAQLTSELSTRLIILHKVVTNPRKQISLENGARLFANQCSSCHGAEGFGNGPAAQGLEPAPNNFHDRVRQGQRNPYSLFNTITLGVDGTAMRSYARLSEQQRWNLSFYVSTFYHTDAERKRGEQLWNDNIGHDFISNIDALSRITPDEIKQQHGEDGLAILAWLRQNPALLEQNKQSPLTISKLKLQESLAAYKKGDTELAYELAVSAYLEGYELAEVPLTNVAPELRGQIERDMGQFRSMVKKNAELPLIEEKVEQLLQQLQQAEDKLNTTEISTGVAFFSALIILLREGLEAILVLAAIAAFLAKTERRDVMPYMHAGWIGALVLGFLTWLLAEFVFDFSGASRELTEGITGLFAAAMLVYIGFWLHSHTHAERWRAFIHSKLHGVTSGTVWSLSIISFVAVYREVVETVLFYKTLWLQTEAAGHSAIIYGFGTATLTLLLLAWLIFRFSVRLPLALFFRINSALLYFMAIIFAGKGIAALQEAGYINMHHINIPTVDLLGIYPSLESTGLQMALILLAVGWLMLERMKKTN